jgi:quinol monooxygenase YgiN
MILFQARIRLAAADRTRVLRSLSRILGPTRAMPGCVGCRLYWDNEDENTLLFIEEWTDEASLVMHLRDDGAKVLLSTLDYACEAPALRIDMLTGTRGVEFIGECRLGTQRA